MKKLRILLLSLLAAMLLCSTVFAADGFNASLDVDRSVEGQITVTVQDSSVLAEKKPLLTIPCDFDSAEVTGPDGKAVSSTIQDGKISFRVAQGGTYVIRAATVPSVTPPVTPPVPPVIPPSKPSEGTSTVVNPDGSTTTTETTADGSVTKTTTKTDGSTEIAMTTADGSTSTTTADADGAVNAEVSLSQAAIQQAAAQQQAVVLPIPAVTVSTEPEQVPVITVKTASTAPVLVEIPVTGVSESVVAVVVAEDGTEKILKTTVPTEDGLKIAATDGMTIKIIDNTQSFTDVSPEDWESSVVSFVAAREIVLGTGNTQFSPDMYATRGMITTMLARLDDFDTTPEGSEAWYAPGTKWAVEQQISDGTNPEGLITREQLVTMLYRYANEPKTSDVDLSAYPGGSDVSPWAQDAMGWAVEVGIIQGKENNHLDPTGKATRAEVAAVIARYLLLPR